MRLEQVKEVVDDLKKAGLYRINLVGGEPLLREDMGDIIRYVRGRGVQCAMTTNGSLVPKKIEILEGLNQVCVSIDGKPANNDHNRGEGAFDRAMAGMDACRDAGIPVQLSAVLTQQTIGDIDFLVNLAERYQCRVGFSILISRRPGVPAEIKGLYPSETEIRSALSRIKALKAEGRPVLFSAESYRYALNWPDHSREVIMGDPPDGFSPVRCFAGRFFCLVDYNGDIYPCPQLLGIFKAGNIFQEGFTSAFQKAGNHGCRACSIPCSTEFNMFFGLKFRVLLDRFLNRRVQ